MPVTIAKKAIELPTAMPATAPTLRPLEADSREVWGPEGVLEVVDEVEEVLVDAGSRSARHWSLRLEQKERSKQTAARKMCDVQKRRNLRCEIVYVWSMRPSVACLVESLHVVPTHPLDCE